MDAYTAALNLLARREVSTRQLRERLARRNYAADDIEQAIQRLTGDRTLDDHRFALASARMEATIKHRGRRRVLQKIQQQGVSGAMAKAAVDEVFGEIDETALLDRAIARRLRDQTGRPLEPRALASVVRSLSGQGFEPAKVLARLRQKGADIDE